MMRTKLAKLGRILVLGLIGCAILIGYHPANSHPALAEPECCCGPVGTETLCERECDCDSCPITAEITCRPSSNKPLIMTCTGDAKGGVPPYAPYWSTDGGETWQKSKSWSRLVYLDGELSGSPAKLKFTVEDSEHDGSCWIDVP